ncbi:MAG: peptidylprolyl isomerase [Oligoflexus sp.]|nr:peptidylprolyl isomerase [Oligoflexus sp.]
MTVSQNLVVTMNYSVKDEDGKIIDSSEGHEPLSFIQGTGSIIPGLEREILGKRKGDKFTIRVLPEDGYGPVDPSLVEIVPRAQFAGVKNLAVGMQLQAQTDDDTMVVTVVSLSEDEVTVDENHPLAGKTLDFELELLDVRDATAEELQHGHVHGIGGHHH